MEGSFGSRGGLVVLDRPGEALYAGHLDGCVCGVLTIVVRSYETLVILRTLGGG